MSETEKKTDIVGKHFTINGNEAEGWTLNVYHRCRDGAVTPFWNQTKNFDSLKELLTELVELEEVST